ncbi:MAG: HAD-IC family P-type ATPase [Gammaproteobacteria bacterium]|nr:HAD-IC family P-type ATPase [Gammaproteobacteria bacterium]
MTWHAPGLPHTRDVADILAELRVSENGLDDPEAGRRLEQVGFNRLPVARPASIGRIFVRQFKNPLIYILLAAAALSVFVGELIDAGFIAVVLLFNAVIGTVQEYQAEKSAQSLQQILASVTRVRRNGSVRELPVEQLVPGDIVLLESGDRVPADARVMTSVALEVDQSLLTGESLSQDKFAQVIGDIEATLADQSNMVFAGTIILRGRSEVLVTATGMTTQLGAIADVVSRGERETPPLIRRMEQLTRRIGFAYVFVVVLMVAIAAIQQKDILNVLLVTIALAVAAIPEGLPVAITVALSVGMRRMAKSNVIVRRLVAAETLGSCTCIASDKTGTLTVNEMTVKRLLLPGNTELDVSGEGLSPDGEIRLQPDALAGVGDVVLELSRAAALCNDASITWSGGDARATGDPVDIALLVLAKKAGFEPGEIATRFERLGSIPFEPENRFAATLHRRNGRNQVLVKGAVERVLDMCTTMLDVSGMIDLDQQQVEQAANTLAGQGYRVLALAQADSSADVIEEKELRGMCFLGLVGMIDPPRPEARQAIAQCHSAGIRVVMVTGDHPGTAEAIARQLGMTEGEAKVITGRQLHHLKSADVNEYENVITETDVFARVDPVDKLDIVKVLSRKGHYVAVTGDGANDAPALRTAHVGVAMGRKGTDVARESAELVLTDDNFASLVEGIRQGRVAYNNVRKVVFLLVSTGMAEVIMFLAALLAGLPLPFTAVQLLWLNLVTEGIQHVGLAFEKAEGDEMKKPPRSPKESVFNRVMIERTLLSASYMAVCAFIMYKTLLDSGYTVEQSRNFALLLMVLFENVQVLNARSESRSLASYSLFSNPLLLIGTAMAQLVHIGAMYVPGINKVLDVQPVSLKSWLALLVVAVGLVVLMEAHKIVLRRRNS